MADPAAEGLIYVANYRTVTGDEDTASARVEEALDNAYRLACEETRRSFTYGEHTETLEVFANGAVYPAVTPLALVSSPSGATVRSGGVYASSAWPSSPFSPLPATQTVTYTGGYHPFGSGTPPELPFKLVRAICRIAYLMLHPASMVSAGVPAGAKAASVGDVSLSGDLSGFVAVDASIGRDLRGYKRRRAAQPFVRS